MIAYASVNSNRHCIYLGPCDPGYYCPGGQSGPAPPAFECLSGHYCIQGSGTPEPCPNGTFSNNTGNTELPNCNDCTPGKSL